MLPPSPTTIASPSWLTQTARSRCGDLLNETRVFLDEGYIFGPEGEGFERINIACPRAILVEALERIKAAIGSQ